ncbi:hypothetical protein [Streptomyces rimosus]|uniref:hypothetical protein n=1 Tax=Streptomyces rimosus TaxID=1927 RepID=UPI00131E323A|nr:hypothetical protein [Streptomyces rimosus]
MADPIGAAHESLRRLPWTSPEGAAEYAAPGEVDQIADHTEAHIINAARNDVAYALAMAQRPETSRAELCALIEKLAGAVREVASVAELRGERLNAPAAKALESALRAALSQR